LSVQQTLTLGSNSPVVKEVADRLYRLGHLPEQQIDIEVFDENLAAAISHFQQEHGLVVSGSIDEITYQRLEEARWQLGDRVLFFKSGKLMAGEDVFALQRKLSDLGFQPGKIDGLFGRNTERALKEFQKSVGLDTDGISGPTVYKAFGQLTRTVAGGDPHRLRDDLLLEHFSGVANRSIVLDCSPINEQDPCVDIVSRVEGKLAVLGSSVTLTNQTPDFDVTKRANTANEITADIYIHIAQTSYASTQANGCACFYFSGRPGTTSTRGQRLADLLQKEITANSELGDNRTHGKSWDLLRRTSMPAVMIEIAYSSSKHDQKILLQAQQRDQISSAITKALSKFFQPDES